MNTPIDRFITDWFTNGFVAPGPGVLPGNLAWLGHLSLFLIIMIMATLLTGLIGFEREFRGHAAGFRTHILVGVASALVMYISIYGFPMIWPSGDSIVRDPARLAAQVVSGIGFLGAGAIIQTGVSVKGLTTATTLWLVMAIGLACGSGNIIIGILTTCICLVALVAFRGAERLINKRNPIVTVVVGTTSPVLKELLTTANRFGINVKNIDSQIAKLSEQEVLRIRLYCAATSQTSMNSFIDELRLSIRPLEVHVSNTPQ